MLAVLTRARAAVYGAGARAVATTAVRDATMHGHVPCDGLRGEPRAGHEADSP